MTRVPKGYPSDHPAADLLRFKQLLFYVELPPDLATTPALYTEVVKHFRAVTPFVEFLNAPLARKTKKQGRQPGLIRVGQVRELYNSVRMHQPRPPSRRGRFSGAAPSG